MVLLIAVKISIISKYQAKTKFVVFEIIWSCTAYEQITPIFGVHSVEIIQSCIAYGQITPIMVWKFFELRVALFVSRQLLLLFTFYLLLQSLTDPEEFVITRCLNALKALFLMPLMEKSVICKFLDNITPLLSHPNQWIRYGVAECVAKLASVWCTADVHCHLIPRVRPFLAQPAIQINRLVCILIYFILILSVFIMYIIMIIVIMMVRIIIIITIWLMITILIIICSTIRWRGL